MTNDQPQARILLTGASGFLGWNLLQTAPKNIDLIAQVNQNALDPSNSKAQLKSLKCDLSDSNAFHNLIANNFNTVIYAAAYSDISTCKQDPIGSEKVNLELPKQLSEYCGEHQLNFIYYSTDLVFDGKVGHYDETAPTSPLSLYGEQKAKAEEEILSINPKSLIFRCPLLYGEASPIRPAALQMMIKNLKSGEPQKLFIDEFRAPARAKRIAEYTWSSLDKRQGLYNVGGPEAISRYDMGLQLAEIYGLSAEGISPIKQADLPQLGPRPANCSLNSSKAKAEGYHCDSFYREVSDIKESNP